MTTPTVCEWCGRRFESPNTGRPARYCSQNHRKAANRDKHRREQEAARREAHERYLAELAEAHAERWTNYLATTAGISTKRAAKLYSQMLADRKIDGPFPEQRLFM